MNRLIFFVTFAAGIVVAGNACAEWQFSAGLGARQVQVTETDQGGRDMVQEHGWLPGVALRADYAMHDWRIGVAGEVYCHRITYDGQMQSGVPFASDTDTTQTRVGIEMSKQITGAARLIGGIEWDHWQREILGHGNVLGLNERYASWRLLAGGEMRVVQASWVQVHARALIVRAAPERLRVRFENRLYDDAHLTTQSATGMRLAFGVQPTAWPNLAITTEWDWLRVGRSGDAVLFKGGAPAGFVTQAEHARRALNVRVDYRF